MPFSIKRYVVGSLILATAAVLLTACGPSQEWLTCTAGAKASDDELIAACTKVIDAAQDKLTQSGAHNNRALAFQNKHDYPRALEDFNATIELNPAGSMGF